MHCLRKFTFKGENESVMNRIRTRCSIDSDMIFLIPAHISPHLVLLESEAFADMGTLQQSATETRPKHYVPVATTLLNNIQISDKISNCKRYVRQTQLYLTNIKYERDEAAEGG